MDVTSPKALTRPIPAKLPFFFKDVPWLGGKHDGHPLVPVQEYLKIRHQSAEAKALLADLADLQCVCTFGLLESLLAQKVPEKYLLSDNGDGDVVMSDKKMGTLLLLWLIRVQKLKKRDLNQCLQWAGRVESALQWTRHLLLKVLERVATASLQSISYQLLAPIFINMASIVEIGETFKGAFYTSTGVQEVISRSFSFADSCFPIIRYQLREEGWCLLAYERFFIGSMLLQQFASTRKPPAAHGDQCTREACARNTIDISTYSRKHTPETCSCPHIRPRESAVYELLRAGAVPVVQLLPDGTIRVSSSSDTPYVAISHVWVDGLGSTTEEGLPRCQIERIAGMVKGVLPGGAFWMDSLCIPTERSLRKCAIKQMAATYANADVVLVLDSGIRSCSLSSPLEDVVLHIITSGWMQRLWTLQEGLLARKLIFELSDGFVSLDDLFLKSERDYYCNPLILQLLKVLDSFRRLGEVRSQYQPSIPGARLDFAEVVRALVGRWTSRLEDETLAICGLLNVDPSTVLDVEPAERMKTFLLQVQRLPDAVIFMDCPKMDEPGFRWASKSLMRAEAHLRNNHNALCTPEGLYAEYHCACFAPVTIPAGEVVSLFISFDGQEKITIGSDAHGVGGRDHSFVCNTVLFIDAPSRGEATILAAIGLMDGDMATPQEIRDARCFEYMERTSFIYRREAEVKKLMTEKLGSICVEAKLEKRRVRVT
ncbi:hypothetical protein EDD18DRAFT_157808 [Armillaria luteobubalina]|uniref:Heterokaryon incompatibility domain-containing protein n=1 Tax=Armillaria luteobubalina TaxID=153913 RepID=A0AA39Q832_9AGAR|nr:hypothetical protein EDD18DRAFT_157808 [Armillaria luteobubalina]